MKKYGEEYRKISHEIRVLTNEIYIITGWDKETILAWFKTRNILFKGKTPTQMFMEGQGGQVRSYILRCKLTRQRTI